MNSSGPTVAAPSPPPEFILSDSLVVPAIESASGKAYQGLVDARLTTDPATRMRYAGHIPLYGKGHDVSRIAQAKRWLRLCRAKWSVLSYRSKCAV